VRNRRWLAWASAAAIVAGAVAIVGVARRNDRPLSAFHERDLVLVTAFDNRTGDPSLDGTIEYALEAELVQSRFLNVTPRVRAEDTLRLMGKPENTRIDLPIGREICVRDGGIHALLGGRIEKLGSTYLLTATLVEPGSGVTVAGVTEQAGSEEDLAPAVRRLSNAVRQRFGEDRSSVKQSNDRLEQVTTPSLKALRLYTESYHLGDRNEWKSALGLAKEAVREDPSFASARIWLAWALHNTGHPPSEFEPEAGMAVRLADHTTDWERDWIIGSYHELQRDYGEAVTSYERLLLRYPDHRWAIGNLAMDYRALGRVREGVDVIAHASDARPTNGQLAWTAVRTLFATRDFERVARYAARFDALTQVDPSRLRNAENATEEATSRFLPAYMTWSRKDVGATLSIVDRAVREPDLEKAARIAPELHDALLQQAFWFYLALGKSTAAQRTAA
jgi:tetratricopeptide (TPR) repeat protein